jgi:hypothetical protein
VLGREYGVWARWTGNNWKQRLVMGLRRAAMIVTSPAWCDYSPPSSTRAPKLSMKPKEMSILNMCGPLWRRERSGSHEFPPYRMILILYCSDKRALKNSQKRIIALPKKNLVNSIYIETSVTLSDGFCAISIPVFGVHERIESYPLSRSSVLVSVWSGCTKGFSNAPRNMAIASLHPDIAVTVP